MHRPGGSATSKLSLSLLDLKYVEILKKLKTDVPELYSGSIQLKLKRIRRMRDEESIPNERSWVKRRVECDMLGWVATDPAIMGISLLSRSVKQSDRRCFNNIIQEAGLNVARTWGEFITRAKALTIVAKALQSKLHPEWIKLVDLQLLAAYQFEKPQPDSTDLTDWLVNVRDHELLGDSESWYSLFSEGVDSFISTLTIKGMKYPLTVEQFVKQPALWATSGSSVRAKKAAQQVGAQRSTKWVLAYTTDQAQLADMINSSHRNILKPFVKPDEKIKARFIVTADDPPSMKMSYLEYAMQRTLQSCKVSTLFMNNEQYMELFSKLNDYHTSGMVNLDIDQDSFDHQISKRMVLIIIRALIKLAYASDPRPEILFVGQQLLSDFQQMYIQMPDGSSLQWNNGVASGWRWTALIDTIVNYAESFMVQQLNTRYSDDEPKLQNVQGDDNTTLYSTYDGALSAMACWQLAGIDFNVSKTLIATENGEYLRMVYGSGNVRGYPARVLSSLLIGESPNTHEATVQWVRLLVDYCSRLHDFTIVDKLPQPYISLVHTPNSYGGLGLPPLQVKMAFKPSVDRWKRTRAFLPYQVQRMSLMQKSTKESASRFFQLIDTTRQAVTLVTGMPAQHVTSPPMSPFFQNPDAPYIIVDTYKEFSDQWEQMKFCMDEPSRQFAIKLESIATERIRHDWMLGRLLMPAISGANARVDSALLKRMASISWIDMLSFKHISYPLWRNICLSIEMRYSAYRNSLPISWSA